MNRSAALDTLGLSDPVGLEDVQAAFRRLAKRAHPDLNGTDTPLRRLILARDLLIRQMRNGPDMTEIIEELSDMSEPLPISVAQAIIGGPTRVDVPMPLELIHDAGPGRSLMHRKSIRLILPAGLRDGDRLRLKATRPGGTEHVFRIEIRREAGLYAAGNDLFLTLALDARRLRRGGHLTLPTPHGERDIDLPPSPDGVHLKLSGLGLPATAKHPQGDLHLTIEAIIPPSRPASELLAEFHMKWA